MSISSSSAAWIAIGACAAAAVALAVVLYLWLKIRRVREVAAGLARVDRRVDACVSKTSIVRYDAYEGAGGHQSASLAFLDAARSGVVFTAIQGRDYARIYVKELDHGRAPVALSPEEQDAVERAMAGPA